MDQNVVHEIDIGAKIETGTPFPMLALDERHGMLVFGVINDNENVSSSCVFKFVSDVIQFGHPTDESFARHRLFGSGLKFYSVSEVTNSTWLVEMHPNVDLKQTELRHFIIGFHDSTFECLVRKVQFSIVPGKVADVFKTQLKHF